MSRLVRRDGLALLLFVAATLVISYPLIVRLANDWLPRSGDFYQKLWDIWWFNQTMHGQGGIYHTDVLFFPVGADLRFHSISWTATAFVWLVAKGIGLAPAYKLQVLLGFLAGAYSGYLLLLYLWEDRTAAWLGGALMAFSPYRIQHAFPHPDVAQIAVLPLVVLFTFLALRESRWGAAAAAGALIGVGAWTGIYLFAFTGLMMGPLCLFLLLEGGRWRERRSWLLLAVLLGAALISAGPRVIPMFFDGGLGSAIGAKVDMVEREVYLLDYVIPSYRNPVLGRFAMALGRQVHKSHYLGVIPIALTITGLVTWRRQALTWLWAALLALSVVLMLGPYPLLYERLDFFNAIRPGFFHILLLLPLAVLAAGGMASLLDAVGRRDPRLTLAIAGLVVGITLFETWTGPFAVEASDVAAPSIYAALADIDPGGIVFLPLETAFSKEAMYYQTLHGHPMVGGKTARPTDADYAFIAGNALLSRWNKNLPCDPANEETLSTALDELAAVGYRYIFIKLPDADRSVWDSYFAGSLVFHEDDYALMYRVEDVQKNGLCAEDS